MKKHKRHRLFNKDCRVVLNRMKEGVIDSVICDPPYGLSDPSSQHKFNSVFRRLVDVVFPNLNEFDPELAKYIDLAGIPLQCSNLSRRKIGMIVESGISMPECAVDFDSDSVLWDVHVEAGRESSCVRFSDVVLSRKFKTEPGHFLGDYVLDFRDSVDFSIGNAIGRCGTQFGLGSFSVPIVVTPAAGRCCPLSAFLLCNLPGFSENIGLRTNSGSMPSGSTSVHTSSTAVEGFVLTLDGTGASGELRSAIGTRDCDLVSQLSCTKLVRTRTGASGLPPEFKPCRISVIIDTADGATDAYFHVWLHISEYKKACSIIPSTGFMGKDWDYGVPGVEFWTQIMRVCKPGAMLLAFGGTRTYHRLACAIEDAGWEIRDCVMWIYGSGFPKSLDISKAIDKAAGVEREQIKHKPRAITSGTMSGSCDSRPWIDQSRKVGYHECDGPDPATEAAQLWDGWGTSLKPAFEPIIVAMKPLDKEPWSIELTPELLDEWEAIEADHV